jgi:signal transduction histidine kinase
MSLIGMILPRNKRRDATPTSVAVNENGRILKFLLLDTTPKTALQKIILLLPLIISILIVDQLIVRKLVLPNYIGTIAILWFLALVIYQTVKYGLRLGGIGALLTSGFIMFVYIREKFPTFNKDNIINGLVVSGIYLLVTLIVGKLRNSVVKLLTLERQARLKAEAAEVKLIELNRDLEKKVEERTKELTKEIQERIKAEEAVKTYSQELERSNKELADFAYVASHDLKEPLRKIQTFGGRLQLEYSDALSEGGKIYLSRIENASKRMQNLITDLLSLSRVHTKTEPFKKLDLNTIVDSVISDLEISLDKNKGKIEVVSLPSLEGDSVQIHQLFQNILSNALKFHRPDVPPHIKIFEQREGHSDTHTIVIEDNGIGFDEKYATKIFEVFQRLHGKEEYEGTGIGLAICKKIVERHQGKITCKSTINKGTKFIIEFPTKQ